MEKGFARVIGYDEFVRLEVYHMYLFFKEVGAGDGGDVQTDRVRE